MVFAKKPVTGMRDILPAEMEIRTELMQRIRETYRRYGFTEIETPLMEHISNLCSNQGGENEKLIFKVLKRGEKLGKALESLCDFSASGKPDISSAEHTVDASAFCEEGLRYDLTLPLSRYYAANASVLPSPFKALQMGPVFRADRPQKGRFRQFMQCDIDILGDETNLAEKELITATTEALDAIGLDKPGYHIVINDRRLLTELIKCCGFRAEDSEDILIILDKMDKIGAEGVSAEMTESGYDAKGIEKLLEIIEDCTDDAAGVRKFAAGIGTDAALAAAENVSDIMECIATIPGRSIRICFDPGLVRGMGYYTGTIFEIKCDVFGSSVGGGGRYDHMIGKFTGRDVPAAGFSIGFERIMSILMEQKEIFGLDSDSGKSAWLLEKGMDPEKLGDIFGKAINERKSGKQVFLCWMAKNKKFQKENLEKSGYTEFREFYNRELKH